MNFKSYDLEAYPDRFKELCDNYWPSYKNWFLSDGPKNRPGYTTTYKMLKQHMPEIIPIYENLCELGGGEDISHQLGLVKKFFQMLLSMHGIIMKLMMLS
jgi:hypothetical protein